MTLKSIGLKIRKALLTIEHEFHHQRYVKNDPIDIGGTFVGYLPKCAKCEEVEARR